MIPKDIKRLLTPEELEKAVALDAQMSAMNKKLVAAREKTNRLPREYDRLLEIERKLLARANGELKKMRAAAIAKGKCPRWIRNPKREDGQEYKCPTNCPFFVKEETGEYIEVADWGCGEHDEPVYRYYCKREGRAK